MEQTRQQRLAEQILQDRGRNHERKNRAAAPSLEQACGFDPYNGKPFVVIAPVGGDPGYLPRTPMRKGPVGFYVACRACGGEFESRGMAYCAACMELPAEERRFLKPAITGRMCQGPGCENPIPRAARASQRFCSDACRKRARREATLRKCPAKPAQAV